MNLFISLKENKDLSKNERILANYILKHPEDVLKMSSKDLGKVCFVSTAFASLSFLDALPPGAAVFDLVYHPRQTALLAAARDRGLTAIGGMELLVQQAILAFSRFTGTDLDREAIRRDLLAMVGEK